MIKKDSQVRWERRGGLYRQIETITYKLWKIPLFKQEIVLPSDRWIAPGPGKVL